MVKRKLKPAETSGKIAKTITNDPAADQRKEKLVIFDFQDKACDMVILTKDKELHLPSSFLGSNESNSTIKSFDKTMMDYSSVKVIKAFSFYYPKYWTDSIKCKFSYFLKNTSDEIFVKKSILYSI